MLINSFPRDSKTTKIIRKLLFFWSEVKPLFLSSKVVGQKLRLLAFSGQQPSFLKVTLQERKEKADMTNQTSCSDITIGKKISHILFYTTKHDMCSPYNMNPHKLLFDS